MIHFLKWSGWVATLVVLYAFIGLVGAGAAFLIGAAYVYPDGAALFASGALATTAGFYTRREVRRRGNLPGAHPISQSVRSIITHDWHHREAA